MSDVLKATAGVLATTAVVFLLSWTGWYALILRGNFDYDFLSFTPIWRGHGGEYFAFKFWFSILTTTICTPLFYICKWLLHRVLGSTNVHIDQLRIAGFPNLYLF